MLYIAQLDEDKYCFWSTSLDAPHTKIKSYQEMIQYIWKEESDFLTRGAWLNKLERARVYGVGYGTDRYKADKTTKPKSKKDRKLEVLELIHNNRAGELLERFQTSKPLTLNQIISFYTPTKLDKKLEELEQKNAELEQKIQKVEQKCKLLEHSNSFYADPTNYERSDSLLFDKINREDCADYPHITRDVRETGGKLARMTQKEIERLDKLEIVEKNEN